MEDWNDTDDAINAIVFSLGGILITLFLTYYTFFIYNITIKECQKKICQPGYNLIMERGKCSCIKEN